MPRRVVAIAIAIILTISAVASAKGNRQVRATRIENPIVRSYGSRPILSAADTCVARNDGGIHWRINGWVIGQEVYKRYINPADSCNAPYPFEIFGVGIILHFGNPGSIQLSADIEFADMTNPSCPVPGALADSTSAVFEFIIDSVGLYDFFIFFDQPITVTGPFFAGMFIANIVDSADLVAVVVDSSSHWPNPLPCWSYNMWDTSGFHDLVDNIFWNFPGRLVMYAGGVAGGSGGNQPPPAVRFVAPRYDDTVSGQTILWAQDTSGSEIIDYVTFSYNKIFQPPIEIGQDHDGFSPLRNGIDPAPPGDGFSIVWDPASVPPGFYFMTVTAFDSLGRSSSDEIFIMVFEQTRPFLQIAPPSSGDDFCNTFDINISSSSPDFNIVQFYEQPALLDYSLGLTGIAAPIVSQAASAAAASAIKHWADNGYPALMTDINSLVGDLTALFRTIKNSGTFDGDVIAGLFDYQFDHGDDLDVEFMRNPDYFDIRIWAESEQRAVMLGIGGSKGTWLVVDGFKSWPPAGDPFFISVVMPTTGTVMDVQMRNTANTTEIELFDVWERVDIMVSLVPKNHTVDRGLPIGADFIGNDGWLWSHTPSGLSEDNLYFYRAEGDNGTSVVASTVLLNYNCSAVFMLGDFNSDGNADIGDFSILQDFIAFNGTPPPGGGHRTDTNCDQTINLADLVFYANFLFGSSTSPPCW